MCASICCAVAEAGTQFTIFALSAMKAMSYLLKGFSERGAVSEDFCNESHILFVPVGYVRNMQ